ncbi:MAG: rRNA maturation RNase YbeY [Planctomycetes bacterium]|nr:rRNA maturation RNase YbeY [Planctomycetota bacterium]MBI3847463.1 rRNA maturation RNase YbeY [Planctomycetota bacterium]
MTSRVAVRDSARGGVPLRATIVSALRTAMREEDRPLHLSLALVGDAEMRRLNRTFHGVDGPTDVLAFPQRGTLVPAAEALDGEIVVSLGTARREARTRGVPTAWEASLYAIHGFLHLCGYDDHRIADARVMAQRTVHILNCAGLDPDRLGVGADGVAPSRSSRSAIR